MCTVLVQYLKTKVVQSLFKWSEKELLPPQCFPSPLKPVLQVHLYEVGVFWQIASMWQASLPSAHWSESVYHKNTTRDFTVNTPYFTLQSANKLQNFTIVNKLDFVVTVVIRKRNI